MNRTYDETTGNISTITGTGNSENNLANLSYSWDNIGNLSVRNDNLQGYTEMFCYDNLNRLSTSAVNELGSPSCLTGTIAQKTMGYDGGAVGAYTNGQAGDGNISVKSDIGGYHYGQKGAGPHAVSSIDTSATGGCTLARCLVDGISSPYFYYDSDGNMLCVTDAASCDLTAARSYAWTSFDMAETISTGANTTALAYTPEHARGSLTAGGATMYYLNNPAAGDMEEVVAGTTPVWHTYLSAYGHIPTCAGTAELFTSGGATTTYYFVGDHLASTAALADAGGNQAEYDSYDAWGLARNSGGGDYGTGCLTLHPQSKTLRRFTGQEAIDSYCLINLNARLYDPALGRMLSADPMVADATNGQAFDRYTYALNEPLALTDPSGYHDCGDSRDPDQDDCWADTSDYPGAAGGYDGTFNPPPCFPICSGSRIPGGDSSEAIYGGNWLGFMNGGVAGNIDGGGTGFAGLSGVSNAGESILSTPGGLGWWVTVSVGVSEPGNGEWTPYVWSTGNAWVSGFMTWNGIPSGSVGAGDLNKYFENAITNVRTFIVSPQGVQLTQELSMWGASFRWAGDWVAVGAYGTDVVGTVTAQPELVGAGVIGEAVAVGFNATGDMFSGLSAEMQAIQENNYTPITQFTFTGYTDYYLPPNPLGGQ